MIQSAKHKRLSETPSSSSQQERVKRCRKMTGSPRTIQFALLILLQLAALKLSYQASNVPFKTSFVSSSDYPVRRNGALLSMPLASVESRHQSEVSGSNFESMADEQGYLLTRSLGSYGLFRDEPNSMANLHQTDGHTQEQNHEQTSEIHVEDLIAASSAETRAGAESESPNKTITTTAATTTSTTTTPTTTTALPPATSTSPVNGSSVSTTTTQSSGSSEQSTPSNATTSTPSPVTSTATSSTTSTATVATTTAQASNSSLTPQTIGNQSASNEPPKQVDEASNLKDTQSQEDQKQSSSNRTELGPTPRSLIIEDKKTKPSLVTVVPMDEAERLTTKSLELFASNRSSGARSSICQFGEQNCGKYIVATIPVVDEKANTTRVVSEYVFLPEDSTLNFDQSVYSTTKRPIESELSLKAEHRTIDSDGDIPSPGNDDLELDYVSNPDVDSRTSAEQPRGPANRIQTTTTTKATPTAPTRAIKVPEVQRLSQTSTTAAPQSIPIASTSSAQPQQQVRMSQSTSFSVRVTSSPSSSLRKSIDQQATSGTSMSTSLPVSPKLNSMSQSTALSTTTSTTTNSPPTTRRSVLTRQNQKLLRVPEPTLAPSVSGGTNTSATSRRSTEPPRRDSPTRRAKSYAETHQHRPFFSEPTSDLRRRPGSQFSPLANGADEEEANILTRFAIPSPLSRLSASGTPSKVEDLGRRRSARVRPTQKATLEQLRSTTRVTGSRTIAELREESGRQATREASPTQTNPILQQVSSSAPGTTSTSTTTTTTSSPTTEQSVLANVTQQPAVQFTTTASARMIKSSTMTVLEPSEPKQKSSELMLTVSELDVPRQLVSRKQQQAATSEKVSTFEVAAPDSLTVKQSSRVPNLDQREQQTPNQKEREVLTLISSSASSQAKVGQFAKIEPIHSPLAGTSSRTPAKAQAKPQLSSVQSGDSSEAKLRRLIDELEASAGLEEQLARDSASNSDPVASQQASARKPTTYVASRQQQVARLERKRAPVDDGKWQPTAGEDSGAPNPSDEGASAQSSMPGLPGVDYPIHWQVPKTNFDCRNYEQSGFYADVESDCQAYHSCHKGRGGRHTFLCPNGTLFSQELLTCDWWYNVECSASKLYLAPDATNVQSTHGGLSELSVV